MRVYITCTSSDRVSMEYKELASNIASILAKRGHKLIFNGYDTGMIGKAFLTFKFDEAHTKAIVDIKDSDNLEVLDIDAYEVTTSTFQRSERSFKSAELVIVLPGGVDTLADFFSMLTEVIKRNSNTRIILYDFNNFYKPIIEFLKKGFDKNFVSRDDLKRIDFVNDLDSFTRYLKRLEERSEIENG